MFARIRVPRSLLRGFGRRWRCFVVGTSIVFPLKRAGCEELFRYEVGAQTFRLDPPGRCVATSRTFSPPPGQSCLKVHPPTPTRPPHIDTLGSRAYEQTKLVTPLSHLPTHPAKYVPMPMQNNRHATLKCWVSFSVGRNNINDCTIQNTPPDHTPWMSART